jgi:hypothetical protein
MDLQTKTEVYLGDIMAVPFASPPYHADPSLRQYSSLSIAINFFGTNNMRKSFVVMVILT